MDYPWVEAVVSDSLHVYHSYCTVPCIVTGRGTVDQGIPWAEAVVCDSSTQPRGKGGACPTDGTHMSIHNSWFHGTPCPAHWLRRPSHASLPRYYFFFFNISTCVIGRPNEKLSVLNLHWCTEFIYTWHSIHESIRIVHGVHTYLTILKRFVLNYCWSN